MSEEKVSNILPRRVAYRRFNKWDMIDKQLRSDVVYMAMAMLTASQSKAIRAKVGAIIVKDGIVCSSGYNGKPRGTDNCCEYEGEDGNLHTSDMVVHAELNAVLNMVIANSGASIKDATIYITYAPCPRCSAMIKQCGISRVVFCIPYRDESGLQFLLDNDVDVCQIKEDVMDNFLERFVSGKIQHK